MKSRALKASALAILSAGAFLSNAQAAPTVFSGIDANGADSALTATPNSDAARNSFFANLTGVGTETFESQSGSAPFAINFGAAGTATLTGGGSVLSLQLGSNFEGRYSVPSASSSRFWNVQAGDDGKFSLTFSAPISAFGFYGIDIGDIGGTLTLALTDTRNHVTNLSVPSAPTKEANGSVLYFGFIDQATQYTGIAFNSTAGTRDFFGFDDFSIGSAQQIVPTAVPEPTSVILLGSGLLGLGLIRRRRSSID